MEIDSTIPIEEAGAIIDSAEKRECMAAGQPMPALAARINHIIGENLIEIRRLDELIMSCPPGVLSGSQSKRDTLLWVCRDLNAALPDECRIHHVS